MAVYKTLIHVTEWTPRIAAAVKAACDDYAGMVEQEWRDNRAAILDGGDCIAVCSTTDEQGRAVFHIDAFAGKNGFSMARQLVQLAARIDAVEVRAETDKPGMVKLWRRWANRLAAAGELEQWAVRAAKPAQLPTSTRHLISLQLRTPKRTTSLAMETHLK